MKSYLKIILLFMLTLGLIVAYGMSDVTLLNEQFELDKANMSEAKTWLEAQRQLLGLNSNAEKRDKKDEKQHSASKTSSKSTTSKAKKPAQTPIDTTTQRILFFGDSMIEGLQRRMNDYAVENGHYCQSVCWYSSTSKIWAQTDTLSYFIKKFRPTYVAICLCSNEQFVNDVETKRKQYIEHIIKLIGNIPFVWVSPPSWKQDTGINAAIRNAVGEKRYFDSTKINFKRGSDHVHPVFSSSAMWMDSIAVWMNSQATAHPIRMKAPTREASKHDKDSLCITTYLKPYN